MSQYGPGRGTSYPIRRAACDAVDRPTLFFLSSLIFGLLATRYSSPVTLCSGYRRGTIVIIIICERTNAVRRSKFKFESRFGKG